MHTTAIQNQFLANQAPINNQLLPAEHYTNAIVWKFDIRQVGILFTLIHSVEAKLIKL